jgi:RimJ/RimL family protein N-acetyltransferase
MNITLEKCVVRHYEVTDAVSLQKHANNRKIWINLRDGFPHPYTVKDAQNFISMAKSKQPETIYCIEVNGEAAGGIGFTIGSDVERLSAEIGYWLSEEFWGRGIVTEALNAVTRYAIETYNLTRVYATPYDWNPASARVLEKAGYEFEGRLRKSIIKDGKIGDKLLYAFIAHE